MAVGELLGREQERAAIEGFLDRSSVGAESLLLEGEAGIGKTSLWREALRLAESRGIRVLACRAAEAEAKLSFSALADLLEPVPAEAFDALPGPQRRALDVALLKADPDGAPPNQRAVATAFRSVLVGLAASPTLVAIDDAQWLDRSSAGAIEFAFRRCAAAPLGLLISRRTGSAALEAALADAAQVDVGPLSLGAIHGLLKQRLNRSLPRPRLVRIHAASRGNPFYALEIAREAMRGALRPGEPLPVPRDLFALVRSRISRLSPPTRDALLVAALLAQPSTTMLADFLDDRPREALEEAEAAGVVETVQGVVRFAHPLFAEAVQALAPRQQRRRWHLRLAEATQHPEEKAHHLALAAEGPDPGVAAAMEDAARSARARGAVHVASEFAQLALTLTPEQDDRLARRQVDLADHLFHVGESERAQAILADLVARLEPSSLRAQGFVLLASILHECGAPAAAVDACARAVDEAGDEPELLARAHATWALVDDDSEQSNREARIALQLLDRLEHPSPELEQLALLALVESEFYLGRAIPEAAAARALELDRIAPAPRVADRFGAALGVYLKYSDRLDEARDLLHDARRAAEEEHDESSLPFVMSHLPQLELWAGNWSLAEAHAREHLALSEQLGQGSQRVQALFNVALVEVHLGAVESARATIAEALDGAEALDSPWLAAVVWEARGLLEWSLGDPLETVAALERANELRGGIHLADPGYGRGQADLVEALAALGRLDQAREIVERRAARARALDRSAALAVVARCRALLAAAEGDLTSGAREIEEALAQHAKVTLPFELGRTVLVKGQLERRAKHKAAAKESFERALAIFDHLGAPLWAEKARGELGRVGLRRAADDLTETERRVAELAASGLTNREVAAQLFLSPKTVEANLARAYRKLGIRSRAELGARLAGVGSGSAQT
jgi:DNA-binding CsgD family transcriptional regulator